jgi:hypothetical protein
MYKNKKRPAFQSRPYVFTSIAVLRIRGIDVVGIGLEMGVHEKV